MPDKQPKPYPLRMAGTGYRNAPGAMTASTGTGNGSVMMDYLLALANSSRTIWRILVSSSFSSSGW